MKALIGIQKTLRAGPLILGGLGTIVFVSALSNMGWSEDTPGATNDIDVSVVDHGHVEHVKHGSYAFKQLLEISEEALGSAKDMFRLSVLPEMIQDVKSKELSVEISYKTPKVFRVAYNGRVLRVDRVLIPLSGAYAE